MIEFCANNGPHGGISATLGCFEQLAAALQSWKPDISGDKKNLWMKKWDINLRTWQPLDILVDWLKFHKSYDFANGFEGEFRQLYDEVHEFYEKLARGDFGEDQIFHEQIPLLESSADRLAQYVLRVQALFENEAQVESDGNAEKRSKAKPAQRKIEGEVSRMACHWKGDGDTRFVVDDQGLYLYHQGTFCSLRVKRHGQTHNIFKWLSRSRDVPSSSIRRVCNTKTKPFHVVANSNVTLNRTIKKLAISGMPDDQVSFIEFSKEDHAYISSITVMTRPAFNKEHRRNNLG